MNYCVRCLLFILLEGLNLNRDTVRVFVLLQYSCIMYGCHNLLDGVFRPTGLPKLALLMYESNFSIRTKNI